MAAPRSPVSEFVLASAASSCACLLSNPFEVIKTRMQVQGEAGLKGQNVEKVYKNVVQGLYRIVADEGVQAAYKGIIPGIAYQCAMNGMRFGAFPTVRKTLMDANVPAATFVAGGSCGVLGAICGMPFFIVKCRMQVQSTAAVKVGHQHENYPGMIAAFRAIVAENGPQGLFRGVDACMLRVGIGSTIQLPTFHLANEHLHANVPFLKEWPILSSFLASSLSGLITVTVMNPFDVLASRMCNQAADGSTYSSSFDCFRKTVAHEGPSGLMKGWVAHWCRLGPHTTYCFVFLTAMKQQADKLGVLQ